MVSFTWKWNWVKNLDYDYKVKQIENICYTRRKAKSS